MSCLEVMKDSASATIEMYCAVPFPGTACHPQKAGCGDSFAVQGLRCRGRMFCRVLMKFNTMDQLWLQSGIVIASLHFRRVFYVKSRLTP